jgi:UDP-GlcNAc3NAcA epimerase
VFAGIGRTFKGSKYHKQDYLNTIFCVSKVMKTLKSEGGVALEAHIETPESSAIFSEYPNILKDHALLHLITDTVRLMVVSQGTLSPMAVEEVMDAAIKTHHHDELKASDAISTLAGALAAVKLGIPVAHVEAGLRSFNMAMPEEINRILTDRISRWLFTPTEAAACHLRREGVEDERIVPVGDVMYDMALQHSPRVGADERLLKRLKLRPKGYILATVHRAENTDDPHRLAVIVEALKQVAKSFPVIWPLHPRTQNAMERNGEPLTDCANLHVIEPVGYLDMVQLEKYAAVIATDSGGVQKEAFFYGVPCVTLRDETEWVELIEAGWNRLASLENSDRLVKDIFSAKGLLGNPKQLYGNGSASDKIVAALEKA